MTTIAITQRVSVNPRHGERRDCLDQRWIAFLKACGLVPMPIPNDPSAATKLVEMTAAGGLILTGGNDLSNYGGDSPERDKTESALLDLAERTGLPVLGVCRGMQMIQHRFGVPLVRVEGHVAQRQIVRIHGQPEEVNSFHNFGAKLTREPLDVWALAEDDVVEAVRHRNGMLLGIMWHPERLEPFSARDILLFRRFFGASQ